MRSVPASRELRRTVWGEEGLGLILIIVREISRKGSTIGDKRTLKDLVFTVGHSNHSAGRFVRLLKGHGIEILIDTRSRPYSRHAPQFTDRAGSLCKEHRKLLVEAVELCRFAAAGTPSMAWWRELSTRCQDFSRRLMHHESEENRLLQQAYLEDIGTHD
jgi:hypothetical protein